jgi:hypothetical protein
LRETNKFSENSKENISGKTNFECEIELQSSTTLNLNIMKRLFYFLKFAFLGKYYHTPLSDPVTALPDFIKRVAKIYGSHNQKKGIFYAMVNVMISFEYHNV